MTAIVANSVLPARRLPLRLRTEDGLALVGELALPEDREPVAAIVCAHPLPTHGGMMDSHVLRKMAWRLPALAGIAVLRFNSRGTTSAAGTSEGTFDEARGERLDLDAALAEAASHGLPLPWALGWSFGTDVVLRHGPRGMAGAILLSPPLRFTTDVELAAWAGADVPLVAFVPELDDYLRPAQARERFAAVPHARIEAFEGAKHLWVGERSVIAVLDAIVATVLPGRGPLPTTWEGPMERWSDL